MAVDGTTSQTIVCEPAVTQSDLTGLGKVAEDGIRALLRLTRHDTPELLKNTPIRFLSAFFELTEGYNELDGPDILFAKRFPAPGDDLIILKDIEFVSICEHHLMPFGGQAHVAYVPEACVVGLSKLARLVDYYSRRLQLQERLTHQIATAIMTHVSAKGAACVIEATHGCLSCRGARKARATFITSSMLGLFRNNGELRREFFSAVHLTHSRI